MDRLYQERMARLVLDRLLDSGGLRSVASQRALSLRMHYLPPHIRLEVPAEEDWLPLLDPMRQERAAAGLREAILRVVDHEERDHWVVVDPVLVLDIDLREGTRRPRVLPVYEPDLAPAIPGAGSDLGEPRLRLLHDAAAHLLRERQGMMTVDLGARAPRLVVFEAPRDSGAVAWLYATGPVDLWEETKTRRIRPRTRIPVDRDLGLTILAPWYQPWARSVRVDVEVLGLARTGRPALVLRSSRGETVRWQRGRDPRQEVGPELVLHAGERDLIEVHNHGRDPAFVRWFDERPLLVPPGDHVALQGAHLRALETPGGVRWTAELERGGSAPPPRLLRVVAESEGSQAPAGRGLRGQSESAPSLFGFEQASATLHQEAVVLSRHEGDELRVAVQDSAQAGPIAQLALDDAPGLKVRQADRGGAAGDVAAWRHVTDVRPLEPTRCRLEAVGQPTLILEAPRAAGRLTTDPADRLALGSWRLRLAPDGLEARSGDDTPLVLDGQTFVGSANVPRRDQHRFGAGGGVYTLTRD